MDFQGFKKNSWNSKISPTYPWKIPFWHLEEWFWQDDGCDFTLAMFFVAKTSFFVWIPTWSCNMSPLKIYRPKKEMLVFQPSFFRRKLAVKQLGGVKSGFRSTWPMFFLVQAGRPGPVDFPFSLDVSPFNIRARPFFSTPQVGETAWICWTLKIPGWTWTNGRVSLNLYESQGCMFLGPQNGSCHWILRGFRILWFSWWFFRDCTKGINSPFNFNNHIQVGWFHYDFCCVFSCLTPQTK